MTIDKFLIISANPYGWYLLQRSNDKTLYLFFEMDLVLNIIILLMRRCNKIFFISHDNNLLLLGQLFGQLLFMWFINIAIILHCLQPILSSSK